MRNISSKTNWSIRNYNKICNIRTTKSFLQGRCFRSLIPQSKSSGHYEGSLPTLCSIIWRWFFDRNLCLRFSLICFCNRICPSVYPLGSLFSQFLFFMFQKTDSKVQKQQSIMKEKCKILSINFCSYLTQLLLRFQISRDIVFSSFLINVKISAVYVSAVQWNIKKSFNYPIK